MDGQSCKGNQGQYAETVVTIELHALDGGIRFALIHEFLPHVESQAAHRQGPMGCLDSLVQSIG
jgi:hypothetical protein